jgi:DNA-binding transcriptional LysR family regulator
MQKRIEKRLDADGFDWVLLRSFLAIYRSGTVAGAARSVNLQQSTLSRHLADLETQLAEPLFERTGRGLHATDAAHLVARYAQDMESLAHQMTLSLAAKSAMLSGTVRVSSSQIFASYVLPAITRDLIRRHPGLQIDIVASDDVPSLLHRATDIALRFTQPTDLNVVARQIGKVPIAAVAHESYLQAMGTPQQPSDLLHHHLLGIDKDSVMIPALQAMDIAVTPAHFRIRTDDKAVCTKLIESGAGIGFVARLMLDINPSLRQVLPGLPLPTLTCWLTTHTEISNSPLIRVVYDEIAERVSRLLTAAVPEK